VDETKQPSIKEYVVPAFPTLTHVALTISDLGVSVPWYERLIGSAPALDENTGPFHHTVFAIGGTLLGLHTFPEGPTPGDTFEERRIGLDHVAFQCANRGELEQWQARLDELGIKHGGIVDAHYGSGLSFRDPDNIALEFFAPPAA
jgi:glyoxylase I family protein